MRGQLQSEIHVWRVKLGEVNLPWAEGFLSNEERVHCNSFRLASPRAEFVRSRAAVRRVCGDYLDIDPSAVRFRKNPFGKLQIYDFPAAFNVSHSKGVALIAVAPRAVGIDLEWIDGNFDWRPVAERFFMPAEMRYISQVPLKDQIERFLYCWTRREAFVKARGIGDPTAAPELLSNRIFHGASTWSIQSPYIIPGFVCCVVSQGEPLPLRMREWHSEPAWSEERPRPRCYETAA